MTKTLLLTTAMVLGLSMTAAEARDGGREAMFDFSAVDTDADGFISAEEIAAAAEARFAETDTDGNGVLDADELAAAAEARMAERAARGIDRMISRMDTDEDGALSFEEMQPAGDRTERMFARVDTDGDGLISAEEAEKMGDHRRHGGRHDRHHERGGERGEGGDRG